MTDQDADISNASEAPAHDEDPKRPPLPVECEGEDGEARTDVPASGCRPHCSIWSAARAPREEYARGVSMIYGWVPELLTEEHLFCCVRDPEEWRNCD